MLDSKSRGQDGIEGLNSSTGAESGLHDTGSAAACAASATRSSARASARCTSAKAADPTARRSLHQPRGHTAHRSSGFSAEEVSICDREVVAGNREVEVVLEGESNGVVQREHQLAVVQQVIDPRTIGKRRRWNLTMQIWRNQKWKVRGWLGVVLELNLSLERNRHGHKKGHAE